MQDIPPMMPKSLTLSPIVVGTNALGLKFKDGVILASDTAANYGSLKKFQDFSKISKISDSTAIVATGEMSDFQWISDTLKNESFKDSTWEDGYQFFSAKEYASRLAGMMYYRRTRMNPLYNVVLVGGFDQKGEKYLGYIDMYGTSLTGDYVVSGLAHYFCKVLLRDNWKPDMSEADGKALLEQCMKVLAYRDCRASERIQFCTITKAGVKIDAPYEVKGDWNYKFFLEEVNEKLRSVAV